MEFDGDYDIFEDDWDILEIIEHGFPRRIYNRAHYFEEMDDFNFYRRFRLTKPSVEYLLTLIEGDLEFNNNINQTISPMNRLLTCLRFYGTNGNLITISDFGGMHYSTVSRIIKQVSAAIARLRPQFVKMPTQQEIVKTQNGFYETASFPRVIGAVDGTHIRIQSPGGNDAEVFRNRKGYFSINVQAVCTHNLKFQDIVARWPGSTHDSTIFNNCQLRAKFETGYFPNCILLGDSGYPIRPYFFTPLLHPIGRPQQLYNQAHILTRNCVERLFGVWKRRFPVMAYGMRLEIDTVLNVIVATAVLHNLAVDRNELDIPPPEHIEVEELEELINMGQIPNIPNQNDVRLNVRDDFINNYFANL